jgi:hypothetical protein
MKLNALSPDCSEKQKPFINFSFVVLQKRPKEALCKTNKTVYEWFFLERKAGNCF